MNIIIIEDEIITAKKLNKQICRLYPDIDIIGNLSSVSDSIKWFKQNPMPDLIFMDIRLSDDLSFQIFDSIDITSPIIFTTAYDEFALEAFKVSTIDYLLKPINDEDLTRAINKYKRLISIGHNSYTDSIKSLINTYNSSIIEQYPHSILVENRDKLIPIITHEIAYLYFSPTRTIEIVKIDGSIYSTNGTLENYLRLLNPRKFYRANRQFIIAKRAVNDITLWFNSRLIVNLCMKTPERIIISKTNCTDFKKWLTIE